MSGSTTASGAAELDDFDRKILRALQASADYSMADLGSLIGLSHTPCWRRLKRLEAEGIIRGKVTLIDPDKVNMNVVVHSGVRMTEHRLSRKCWSATPVPGTPIIC